MRSALYVGAVAHRRIEAPPHAFRKRLFLTYLDLEELPRLFAGRWLWGVERPAWASFRRADHLGPPEAPLADAVRDLVATETGERPEGPIRLLTQLRFAGYAFNPLSLHFCFAPDGERVQAIVADVRNTPWNERHAYVLPVDPDQARNGALRFQTRKVFHVSPFLGMDCVYRWRIRLPGEALALRIEARRNGRRIFVASLGLRRRPITGRQLAAALAAHPLMPQEVIAGIYWQALRLRAKGAVFHPHPAARPKEATPT